jgi:hypothetical protein
VNVLTSAHQLHLELDQAITDELDEIERSGRTDMVHVTGGKRLGLVCGQWRYRLDVAGRVSGLRRGIDAVFEHDGRTTLITVHSRSDAAVDITAAEELGPEVCSGRIIIDSRWLLLAQQRRVRDVDAAVRRGITTFNISVALQSVGVADLAVSSPIARSVALPTALNAEQQRLIELCYARSMVALWGPPGTGKSYAVIHLITTLLNDGLRVLYSAPTNVSVDDLLQRGVETFRAQPWWQDGSVIRLGPADGLTLDADLQDQLWLPSVVMRRIGGGASAARYQQQCRQIVDRARLTAATVNQSYLSPLLASGGWDVLIVDEASMVAPASLYLGAGLAQRVVIAGDFRQLPPVGVARSAAATAWLRRDPYQALGIPEDIARGDYPDYLVMLSRQYRMAPGIADLVSGAYDQRLETDASVLARSPGAFGRDAVLYVDSHSLDPRVEIVRGGSRTNEVHAVVVRNLLLNAVSEGALQSADLRDVLVLSPFAAQAHLLERTLRSTFRRNMPTVRTIHRAQGREANVVILDLTDAGNQPASRFFSAREHGDESARLLTVAVTRAREHLIVVGDMPHMLRDRRVGRIARELINAVMSGGRCEPSRGRAPRQAA